MSETISTSPTTSTSRSRSSAGAPDARQAAPRRRVRASGQGAAIALVAAGAALLAAGCAGSGPATGPIGSTVSILAAYTGAELETFREVLAPWEERTGSRVDYAPTRDLPGVLAQRIADGDRPDIAGLAGPAHLADLARQGVLQDLSTAVDLAVYTSETAPAFVELGSVDGRVVGAFLRSTLKGLLWYDPATYRLGEPATWDELQRSAWLSATGGTHPWCVGLASGPDSGWPGTDWIENLLLRTDGPQVYDEWVAGRLSWTSPEIRRAFLAFGRIVAQDVVHGGPSGALSTDFRDAGDPLFDDPAGCVFLQQASFMPSFFHAKGLRPTVDYDMLPFPDIDPRFAGSVEVAGDLYGLLGDSSAARDLMRYLTSEEAQSIWVAKGAALSGNLRVTTYPDPISEREAKVLGNARRIRFDASDQMPEAMNRAFWQAVLDFTRDQSRLDTILAGLDAVRVATHATRR